MKKIWKRFRFWLLSLLVNISISVADKESIEGISFIIAMRDWINYINSEEANNIRENKLQ